MKRERGCNFIGIIMSCVHDFTSHFYDQIKVFFGEIKCFQDKSKTVQESKGKGETKAKPVFPSYSTKGKIPLTTEESACLHTFGGGQIFSNNSSTRFA